MAKTKRTVEEVEAAVESTVEAVVESTAAAASSDSKLITQSKLSHFATGFWNRIKDKYDGTFKDANLTEDKKLIFTKVSGTPKEINLKDYARLTDKSEFKKDVSVDDAGTKSNLSIGQRTGIVIPSQRSLGARNLSSGLFTDGYVSKLRVYLDSAVQQTQQVNIHVWAIKKGDTKSDDRTAKAKLISGDPTTIESGNNKKWIDIPINEAFANDTYFIFRTSDPVNVEAISNIAPENSDHVINLVVDTPPNEADRPLIWTGERKDITAHVEIFGRMGIVDLNKKIEKVSADSSLYVKQEETTKTGGTASANKVVRLDNNGKLDKDMLPSIAINEYFEIDQFTHEKLDAIKDRFENGDVVVVTGSGANHGKRFLCVNKKDNLGNLVNGFVELNSKDGIVKSVNGKIGDVVLDLAATEDSLKLTIGNGTDPAVEKIVHIVTEGDIDSIINGLRD